jgi:Phosphate/sulphate permeases
VLTFGFRIGRWLDGKPHLLRPMTLVTGGFVAYAHGANDAQKTMGVITLALLSAGYIDTFAVPTWVILACACAMALGTYAGGWRIVATLGHRITELNMRRGMLSQVATAAVLFTTARRASRSRRRTSSPAASSAPTPSAAGAIRTGASRAASSARGA